MSPASVAKVAYLDTNILINQRPSFVILDVIVPVLTHLFFNLNLSLILFNKVLLDLISEVSLNIELVVICFRIEGFIWKTIASRSFNIELRQTLKFISLLFWRITFFRVIRDVLPCLLYLFLKLFLLLFCHTCCVNILKKSSWLLWQDVRVLCMLSNSRQLALLDDLFKLIRS